MRLKQSINEGLSVVLGFLLISACGNTTEQAADQISAAKSPKHSQASLSVQVMESLLPYANFVTVDGIGDFDGDGRDDFVYSVSGAHIPDEEEQAVVISGMSGDVLLTATDSIVGASAAGDANGDGLADVAVLRFGEVSVHAGGSGDVLWTFNERPSIQRTGGCVNKDGSPVERQVYFQKTVPAGDVNGDGFGDLLILGRAHTGYAVVVSGHDGSPLLTVDPEHLRGIGPLAAQSAGDFDQDGFDDLLIGTSMWTADKDFCDGLQLPQLGKVVILSGADQKVLFEAFGSRKYEEDTNVNFGQSVSMIDDLNQDGIPDLIVSAPGYDLRRPGRHLNHNEGRVYVLSGHDGSEIFVFDGQDGHGYLGRTVDRIDDFDGDGSEDFIIVSDVHDSGNGLLNIHSGRDGRLLYSHSGEYFFGRAAAHIGDIDGDGRGDVAAMEIGYPLREWREDRPAKLYLFSAE